jgi:hypothetical protein
MTNHESWKDVVTTQNWCTHGSKHDEDTSGGRKVTRRVDPNTGHSVGR